MIRLKFIIFQHLDTRFIQISNLKWFWKTDSAVDLKWQSPHIKSIFLPKRFWFLMTWTEMANEAWGWFAFFHFFSRAFCYSVLLSSSSSDKRPKSENMAIVVTAKQSFRATRRQTNTVTYFRNKRIIFYMYARVSKRCILYCIWQSFLGFSLCAEFQPKRHICGIWQSLSSSFIELKMSYTYSAAFFYILLMKVPKVHFCPIFTLLMNPLFI